MTGPVAVGRSIGRNLANRGPYASRRVAALAVACRAVPLPSEIYDRDYFLSDRCEGYDRFAEDRGLSPLKRKELELLDVRSGQSVLDAGCGRGEVLLACAERGAS